VLDFAGDVVPVKETKQSLVEKKKKTKTEDAPTATKGTILEYFKTDSTS